MSYSYSWPALGDAAMDAYTADHSAWLQEKAAFDNAVKAYTAMSAGRSAGYSQAQSGYLRDLAAWQAESAARTQAVVAYQRQILALRVARDRANTQAKAAGAILPPDYSGCVTPAQHASWQADCNAFSAVVKGFGSVPAGPACALALLPVCTTPPSAPAPLRPQPTPPAPPAPLPPPPTLRPEPMPPAAPPAPVVSPAPAATPAPPPPSSALVPSLTPQPAAPPRSAGALRNGLLIIVIGGASYALYRTLKKPKAAA